MPSVKASVFGVVVWQRKGGVDLPPYPPCVEALSLGILMRDGVSDKHGKEVCTLQYKNKLWEGYIDSDHGTYITLIHTTLTLICHVIC